MQTGPDQPTRLLIVADDRLARAGLAALLAGQPGLHVTGTSASSDAAALVELDEPDAILWDLGWEPATALDHLEALADGGPSILALLPGASEAPAARRAGARALLPRDAEPRVVVAALGAVRQGLVVLAPAFMQAMPSRGPRNETFDELTARETEVLNLLVGGLANKAIALRLGLSEHTVKFHVNAIMGKLGAQSRTEAVSLAFRLGLINL